MTTNTGKTLAMAAILGLFGAFAPSTAAAADFAEANRFRGPQPIRYEPRDDRNGHFETRETRVLVSPERTERVWVEPAYRTRYNWWGRPVKVLVSEGYWREVCIPARYETRSTQVWVPHDRNDRNDRHDRRDWDDRRDDGRRYFDGRGR